MTRIISLINHKGGVGKTTTTLNLGKALAMQKKKVLIVDIDPQANLSRSLGIISPTKDIYDSLKNKQPLHTETIDKNFYLVPATLRLAQAETELVLKPVGHNRLNLILNPIKEDYDFILIDCPPSLGILTVNALIASTEYMIIVQSHYLAVDGLTTVLNVIDELSEELEKSWILTGILLTYIKNTNISKESVSFVKQQYPNKVFKAAIRENTSLIEASASNEDIFAYNSKSFGAEDYMSLSKEILNNG